MNRYMLIKGTSVVTLRIRTCNSFLVDRLSAWKLNFFFFFGEVYVCWVKYARSCRRKMTCLFSVKWCVCLFLNGQYKKEEYYLRLICYCTVCFPVILSSRFYPYDAKSGESEREREKERNEVQLSMVYMLCMYCQHRKNCKILGWSDRASV